jgi:hypothetical protein
MSDLLPLSPCPPEPCEACPLVCWNRTGARNNVGGCQNINPQASDKNKSRRTTRISNVETQDLVKKNKRISKEEPQE